MASRSQIARIGAVLAIAGLAVAGCSGGGASDGGDMSVPGQSEVTTDTTTQSCPHRSASDQRLSYS